MVGLTEGMEGDDGWSEIGVVLSERVQRLAGRGDGVDCSDVRVLPVLGCRRAVRVQSAAERAAMLEQRRSAGIPATAGAACVDMAALDLREAVGSGTFATVHRGVYRGQPVAVKVFNDKASPESLARELALSCALVHPNIVRCVGVGWQPAPAQPLQAEREEEEHSHSLRSNGNGSRREEDAEVLWKPVLVMEYCVLGSLFQMLYPVTPESKTRRAATVSPAPLDPHARAIARGVAAALAHLHAFGYAHFDLCSSNVLVCNALPSIPSQQQRLACSVYQTTHTNTPTRMPLTAVVCAVLCQLLFDTR